MIDRLLFKSLRECFQGAKLSNAAKELLVNSVEAKECHPKGDPMKLGIIIYSDHSETVWNAFRLGVFSLKRGDSVKVFLLARGVECESLNSPNFEVTKQMSEFVELGGKILACGTCLKIRDLEGSEMCPLSTMEDLYNIMKESDKIVSL
jgi:uncharacterized protein involved in oxidation of intracellular sulfur